VPDSTVPDSTVPDSTVPDSTRPALAPDELIGWARERLAGFKCPTGISIVDALPRNATGKVQRAALREPFWAGRDRRVS
jgi:acyl-CoA synthetase (AMP-forming)/AMP-acid ligase II